jgi:hypothetical protein
MTKTDPNPLSDVITEEIANPQGTWKQISEKDGLPDAVDEFGWDWPMGPSGKFCASASAWNLRTSDTGERESRSSPTAGGTRDSALPDAYGGSPYRRDFEKAGVEIIDPFT